jgi:phage gpG-like protein
MTVYAAILNLGGLLSGSAPHREDLAGTTMIPKRPAAKFDPADLAV